VWQTLGDVNQVVVTYTYDVLGRRVQQDEWTIQSGTTTTTRFGYDGDQVWADLTAGNVVQTRYVYGDTTDQVLARTDTTLGLSFYLTDHLGSVRGLTDSSGVIQDAIDYTAFGAVNFETSATYGGHIKYTGREYDAATGLYDYRARYYDPATGRFTTNDPLDFGAGDTNLSRYVFNYVTGATDPSGRRVWATGAGKKWLEERFNRIGVKFDVEEVAPDFYYYRMVGGFEDNSSRTDDDRRLIRTLNDHELSSWDAARAVVFDAPDKAHPIKYADLTVAQRLGSYLDDKANWGSKDADKWWPFEGKLPQGSLLWLSLSRPGGSTSSRTSQPVPPSLDYVGARGPQRQHTDKNLPAVVGYMQYISQTDTKAAQADALLNAAASWAHRGSYLVPGLNVGVAALDTADTLSSIDPNAPIKDQLMARIDAQQPFIAQAQLASLQSYRPQNVYGQQCATLSVRVVPNEMNFGQAGRLVPNEINFGQAGRLVPNEINFGRAGRAVPNEVVIQRASAQYIAETRAAFEAPGGVRAQFWQNEVATNPGIWSSQNQTLMRQGNAPFGTDGRPRWAGANRAEPATGRPRWPTSRPSSRSGPTPDQRQKTPPSGSCGPFCGLLARAHVPLPAGSGSGRRLAKRSE
jgi:RHS repeat-associated protein